MEPSTSWEDNFSKHQSDQILNTNTFQDFIETENEFQDLAEVNNSSQTSEKKHTFKHSICYRNFEHINFDNFLVFLN